MDTEIYQPPVIQLSHALGIFVLLGGSLFLLYWLWVYPCNGRQNPRDEGAATHGGGSPGRVISPPEVTSSSEDEVGGGGGGGGEMVMYALEVEPGTIVLQSPNGDLFRVLHELDSVNRGGSPSSGLPPGTSVPVHYIPAYTRAHVQNRSSTTISASAPYAGSAAGRRGSGAVTSAPYPGGEGVRGGGQHLPFNMPAPPYPGVIDGSYVQPPMAPPYPGGGSVDGSHHHPLLPGVAPPYPGLDGSADSAALGTGPQDPWRPIHIHSGSHQ